MNRLSILLMSLVVGCMSVAAETSRAIYRNPVIDRNMPDPTIVRGDDGFIYLYATESQRKLPIWRSRNLVDWEFAANAFTAEGRPGFVEKAGIWAPDVSRVGDGYVMHYSMSVWGGEWTCGIGSAWAATPAGPFIDHGKMFISNEIGIQNCIDPFYIEDNGHKYLMFGSFGGIYMVELSGDALSVKDGYRPVQVAGSAYEGTYIHRHGGYYYLFASTGTCCEGLKSTYSTVVGRSKNVAGPYVDRKGQPMLDDYHEMVIEKNDHFVGTGHNSEIVTDDAGNDWILYHAVDVSDPKGRKLMLDKIEWIDGWPTVKNGTPSTEAAAPVFKK